LRNSLQRCGKTNQIILVMWGALVVPKWQKVFLHGTRGHCPLLHQKKHLALGAEMINEMQ